MTNNPQKKYFLEEGADAWYDRALQASKDHSFSDSYPSQAIRDLPFKPTRILEIGCAKGDKLALLQQEFQCECHGIDPSKKAIEVGSLQFSDLNNFHLQVGTADKLPYEDDFFDVIHFGGCLCWCDRNCLFDIAKETHRVLKKHGAILILDFETQIPIKNSLHHTDQEIWTYKMKYENLFTWHPQYVVSAKRSFTLTQPHFSMNPNDRFSLTTIIKVSEDEGILANPWVTHASK